MSVRVGSQSDAGRPIGEIAGALLNRNGRRRTASMVRHGSVLRQTLHGFFRAVDRREVGLILKAAERLDDLTKAKGRRNGTLGYTGLKVLKALLSLVDYRTGRLEPSYVAIAEKAKLSISAVAEALKRLVANGFLVIQRRCEPTGNEGPGPRLRQITNAYRVELPALAAKTLRSAPPAPLPDDERHRRQEARAERERMIAQLPTWQQPVVRADVVDRSLAEILESLGRRVYAAEPST
jgi:DNA-binding MarR family transcriptional regulator